MNDTPKITGDWLATLVKPIHERRDCDWGFKITATNKDGDKTDEWWLPLGRPELVSTGLVWRTDQINFLSEKKKTWFWTVTLWCDSTPVATYGERLMTRSSTFHFALPLPYFVNVVGSA